MALRNKKFSNFTKKKMFSTLELLPSEMVKYRVNTKKYNKYEVKAPNSKICIDFFLYS